jgi:hypothetical protein
MYYKDSDFIIYPVNGMKDLSTFQLIIGKNNKKLEINFLIISEEDFISPDNWIENKKKLSINALGLEASDTNRIESEIGDIVYAYLFKSDLSVDKYILGIIKTYTGFYVPFTVRKTPRSKFSKFKEIFKALRPAIFPIKDAAKNEIITPFMRFSLQSNLVWIPKYSFIDDEDNSFSQIDLWYNFKQDNASDKWPNSFRKNLRNEPVKFLSDKFVSYVSSCGNNSDNKYIECFFKYEFSTFKLLNAIGKFKSGRDGLKLWEQFLSKIEKAF